MHLSRCAALGILLGFACVAPVSGIYTTKGSKDIYPQRDLMRFALGSELISEPGLEYQNNNRAINIATGVIGRATGKSMEAFLVEHLFRPLEINE